MALQYKYISYESEVEMRLDRWIRREYGDVSQGIIEKAARNRFVRVNGQKIGAGVKLITGDQIGIEIHLFEQFEQIKGRKREVVRNVVDFKPEILLETNDFFVLNKPSGLDVQGGKNVEISVDMWIKSVSEQYRLVHRLDRETSGALIIAKTLASAIFFAKLFKERKIRKTYRAIVLGRLTPDCGQISAPLITAREAKGLVEVDTRNGKKAETKYRSIFYDSTENWTDVELEPQTGRKHQLRVHMAHIEAPIVGDRKYDTDNKAAYLLANAAKGVLYLHAKEISFKNQDGVFTSISTPLPQYWPQR
ncbi:MAG: RluA family pseudouridine synthase [Holosporales bacterium]|jgi:23S rRNA pseudouridine955/2504/2580 synthase|nr:RluA family pseudouridine synthase [Holosporales bacterium]